MTTDSLQKIFSGIRTKTKNIFLALVYLTNPLIGAFRHHQLARGIWPDGIQ